MTDTPVGNWRPKHLSHSAIERFVSCPRSYWMTYVKKSPFVASKPMLIGTLFGKMIEDAHGGWGRWNGPPLTDDEVTVALNDHYNALRANERALLDDEALDIVARMFNLYRSREGGPYNVEPEYEFLVYLPDRERVPYPIRGFMDGRSRIEPFILEAKTSKWMDHHTWGWDQRRVDSSPQAALYWYYDSSQHQRDSEVRYLLLGYSDRGVSMRELTTHPNMERVEQVQDDAARLCEAIENEDFQCYCQKCKVAVP